MEQLVCSHCGDEYVEELNIGRWLCRRHAHGATLVHRHPTDPWRRYTCCGLTERPLMELVHTTPSPPPPFIPPADPSQHWLAGCTPCDHDTPDDVVAMRAWAKERLKRVRPEALVTDRTKVATLLGARMDATWRRLFWDAALTDPRVSNIGGATPAALAQVDPVARGLVVAVWRRDPAGPPIDYTLWTQAAWDHAMELINR